MLGTSDGGDVTDLRRIGVTLTIVFILAMLASGGTPSSDKLALANEPSRDDLAQYASSLEATRAFPTEFNFPKDARTDKIFGIDVSHYQGGIEWKNVADQGVRFAYIKATQGERYYDPFFQQNWSGVSKFKGILRGAYHFMTANDSPERQAQNFLNTIGAFEVTDLPPCLDLEWNWVMKGNNFALDPQGHRIDRWASLSQVEIAKRIITWTQIVEKATGKKPILYTSRSWWMDRVGSNNVFNDYSFWIVDYNSKSLGREFPRIPQELSWKLWQLTNQGRLSNGAIKNRVDTTVLNADAEFFDKQIRSK